MILQMIFRTRLGDLLYDPSNQECSECYKEYPEYASVIIPPPKAPRGSIPLGVFCCGECAISHRNLGENICIVRSLRFGKWTEDEVIAMEMGGNKKINHVFEARLSLYEVQKPNQKANSLKRDSYIREKYLYLKFYDCKRYAEQSNELAVSNSIMGQLEHIRSKRHESAATSGTQANSSTSLDEDDEQDKLEMEQLVRTNNLVNKATLQTGRNVRRVSKNVFKKSSGPNIMDNKEGYPDLAVPESHNNGKQKKSKTRSTHIYSKDARAEEGIQIKPKRHSRVRAPKSMNASVDEVLLDAKVEVSSSRRSSRRHADRSSQKQHKDSKAARPTRGLQRCQSYSIRKKKIEEASSNPYTQSSSQKRSTSSKRTTNNAQDTQWGRIRSNPSENVITNNDEDVIVTTSDKNVLSLSNSMLFGNLDLREPNKASRSGLGRSKSFSIRRKPMKEDSNCNKESSYERKVKKCKSNRANKTTSSAQDIQWGRVLSNLNRSSSLSESNKAIKPGDVSSLSNKKSDPTEDSGEDVFAFVQLTYGDLSNIATGEKKAFDKGITNAPKKYANALQKFIDLPTKNTPPQNLKRSAMAA